MRYLKAFCTDWGKHSALHTPKYKSYWNIHIHFDPYRNNPQILGVQRKKLFFLALIWGPKSMCVCVCWCFVKAQNKDLIPLFKVIEWCSWCSLHFYAYCKDKDMPYKSIIPASRARCLSLVQWCPLPVSLCVLCSAISTCSSLAIECHSTAG